jgi:uncharacterized membrane protein YfcA
LYLHLTIAQLTVFWPTIVGVGLSVGFLSGMFGVGGGFLVSPLLMFLGIPIEVAVATGANQAAATSASAATAQWRYGNVDLRMSGLLILGGGVGSFIGVFIVSALRAAGQIEFVVSVCYAMLLGTLGLLMFIEGVSAMRQSMRNTGSTSRLSRSHHSWIHGLPFKTRFRRSKLFMSIIPPLILGLIVGMLGAVMGVGGGFLLVPAMVYLLKMPTQVVIGTSLIQVLVTSSITTVLHAAENHTVDMELAFLLIIGGVIGAQWGARAGANIKSEQLRALLGMMVFAVGVRFALILLLPPTEVFSIVAAHPNQ